MRRVYVDPSDFRAPFDAAGLMLSGLGEALVKDWKPGRQYLNISNFRAPYDNGYFQNNQLFGLGAAAVTEAAQTEQAAIAAKAGASEETPSDKQLGHTLVLMGIGLSVGVAVGFALWKKK